MAAAGGEILFTRSTFSRIVSGSGTLNPPTGAVAMRVAVIGGGGGGGANGYACGGAGGGCAATKIVPASAITYSIGQGGLGSITYNTSAPNGGNTTASFAGYSLIGGGGEGGKHNRNSVGGTGSGGDYSFSGGNGLHYYQFNSTYIGSSGAGAAGPNGHGGDGALRYGSSGSVDPVAGYFFGTGWGAGGGGGGGLYMETSTCYFAGGGGTGARGGWTRLGGTLYRGGDTGILWGTTNDALFAITRSDGGAMGGGGGAFNNGTASPYGFVTVGGSGGMVVEWFYTT